MSGRPFCLAVVLVSGILAGCLSATFSEGDRIPQDRVAEIRIGHTTKSDILAWFGAPRAFTDTTVIERVLESSLDLDFTGGLSSEGEGLAPEEVLSLPLEDAMVFRAVRAKFDARFYVFVVRADVRVESNTLVVFFDEEDRVKYYGLTDDLEEAEDARVEDPRDDG